MRRSELRVAGYGDSFRADILDNDREVLAVDELNHLDEEEKAKEKWLRILTGALLGTRKKSISESIYKWLGSGNLDLVRVCLRTVTWLSYALISASNAEFELSAFSALIYRLKDRFENGEKVERKILASMSLFNFSKIPEFWVLLMTIAEEIAVPLRGLREKSWAAKELFAIFLEKLLDLTEKLCCFFIHLQGISREVHNKDVRSLSLSLKRISATNLRVILCRENVAV